MGRFLFTAAFLFGAFAFAENPEFLTIKKVEAVSLKAGGKAEAVVNVKINPGFHIQANPASTPQLIPTKVEIATKPGLELGATIYPPGKAYHLESSDAEISTYEGAIAIRIPVSATETAKPGKRVLEGKLHFQACNDKICFFPGSAGIKISVKVTK